MADIETDPSIEFGQTEGLWVYQQARMQDGDSGRPDEPIAKLAQDAVRTAYRMRDHADLPVHHIDITLATVGLMAVLEGNIEGILGGVDG